MTPSSESDDRDPASAYADGDPDAVRAARPSEPSEAAWEEMRLGIHARLAAAHEPRHPRSGRRIALWATVGAALTAAAAAVAWVALGDPAQQPGASAVAEVVPLAASRAAPAPPGTQPDPLAEFAVLPRAGDDDVVLLRVPGDGWLPVGAHPLPGELALATADEVELDDPDEVWTNVTKSPADAPMIFAAKPR